MWAFLDCVLFLRISPSAGWARAARQKEKNKKKLESGFGVVDGVGWADGSIGRLVEDARLDVPSFPKSIVTIEVTSCHTQGFACKVANTKRPL